MFGKKKTVAKAEYQAPVMKVVPKDKYEIHEFDFFGTVYGCFYQVLTAHNDTGTVRIRPVETGEREVEGSPWPLEYPIPFAFKDSDEWLTLEQCAREDGVAFAVVDFSEARDRPCIVLDSGVYAYLYRTRKYFNW